MIRIAAESDVNDLVLLLEQLFSIEEDFEFDQFRQKQGLEALLASPSSVILVKEQNNTVVAMVTGQLVISTAEGGAALLVEDVVVAPEYQKKGLGKKLLHAVGEWGKEKGARRVQLLADKHNRPALDFYERVGFQKTNLQCFRKYNK